MTDTRKHILIIEDNQSMLQLYSQVLSSSGFRVTTATDGQLGWMKAQDEHPDLILLDMILPKITGDQLLAKLQKDPLTAAIPIVVFSSVNNIEGVRKAFEAGAVDFLHKAVSSPKQVVSKVQAVLDKAATVQTPAPAAPGSPTTPTVCPHCHKPI